MKGMGKAIRRYREEAGITQERLAELVKQPDLNWWISVPTIWVRLSGK